MSVRARFNIRKWASSLIREYPWVPGAATVVAALGLVLAVVKEVRFFWALGAAVALLCTSYVWGYSARVLESVGWPSLAHLPRRNYAEVWDALASSSWEARAAACGKQVETAVRDSAVEPVGNLLELVAINMGDEVLEIGCGVGRIGRELAPHCSRWTGADVSGNMLACASKRLRELNNVKLVKLQGFGLEGFATNSFDVIYSTNVFAHLDEVDRWRYVEDSLRVLRPAGRLFIDNVDLESEDGWSAFAEGAKSAHQTEFSPYLPRFSTTAEMMTYAKRAGFERVQSYQRPPLLVVTAIKPSQNECTE